jgi:hypothetical protein
LEKCKKKKIIVMTFAFLATRDNRKKSTHRIILIKMGFDPEIYSGSGDIFRIRRYIPDPTRLKSFGFTILLVSEENVDYVE